MDGARQHAFDVVLSEDDGRSRPRPRVISTSENGLGIELELRWASGQRYCCAEPVCVLGTCDRVWRGRLRAALAEVSGREPPPMSLRVHGVIEDGALFTNLEQSSLAARSTAEVYTGPDRRERDAK